MKRVILPKRGKRLGNFNCPLLQNAQFMDEMKNHITVSLKHFDEENIRMNRLGGSY